MPDLSVTNTEQDSAIRDILHLTVGCSVSTAWKIYFEDGIYSPEANPHVTEVKFTSGIEATNPLSEILEFVSKKNNQDQPLFLFFCHTKISTKFPEHILSLTSG